MYILNLRSFQDLEFDGEYSLGQETGKIELPVYLNSTREDLLFTVDLPVQPVGIFRFYQMVHKYLLRLA